MPEILPGDDYPDKVKQIRASLGLTQMALAEELGLSFPTINRWENGKSRPSQLSWSQLLKLAGESEESGPVSSGEPVAGQIHQRLDFTAQPDGVQVYVEGERLSFGHLVNPTFATEIANIDPLPHQRIAVYDHM